MSDSEEEERIPSSSQIDWVAALSHEPDKQLSALGRLLGVNRLLHYVQPEAHPKPKGSFHFISICHEVLGDTCNSLFPDKTEDKIYELSCQEVWKEMRSHLSQISVHNPAGLRMKLHTQTHECFSSMKKFTEKVFSLVKKIRAAGMEITDAEVNGVLFCGINQELYAIQLDKWTSDETSKKFNPADIANELILLERDIENHHGLLANGLLAARALLARHGFSVNAGWRTANSGSSSCSSTQPVLYLWISRRL